MPDRKLMTFEDAAAFEHWLAANHDSSPSVDLLIAKKSVEGLHVTDSLDVALCYGWIDGQRNTFDATHFRQAYGPRTARSTWSQINRDHIARLREAGRMTPAGEAEVDRAKGDGRWDAAYAGSRTIEVPDDLAEAIAANAKAAAFFALLSSQNRYAILFRIANVKREETRLRNIEKFVGMLERGETVYPQKTRD
ncbi:MAG: YdeI/OmpD-associated family protein [Rhodoglobus sp.]